MPTIPGPGETAASRIAGLDRELALFRAVLDTLDEAVLVTSPELAPPGPIIEYVNPAAARMTGYAPEELLGKSPRLLHGPKTEQSVLKRLRNDLRAERRFQGEAVNYRKDGTEYVVAWVIRPLCDEQGKVTHWFAVQRDITEQRRLEARQRNLVSELNHRVNNTLSRVQSIAKLTSQSTKSPGEFAERFQARLLALSQAHIALNRSEWTGAWLRELLMRELAPYGDGPSDHCQVQGPDIWLPPRTALAMAMAFHELAVNAADHGALSQDQGRLRVSWALADDGEDKRLNLEWLERNGPHVSAREHSGFGSRYLERGLPYELQASVQLRFEPDGVSCSIEIPFPEPSEATGASSLGNAEDRVHPKPATDL